METLELNDEKENELNIKSYDEYLGNIGDDIFKSTNIHISLTFITVKKLKYESTNFDYFIAEDEQHYHYILRNKK